MGPGVDGTSVEIKIISMNKTTTALFREQK
jgi:hypothetical protein